MEHWIEVNLSADLRSQDGILLDSLAPYVERLRKKGTLVTYHFFREPEIRFRVRLTSRAAKETEAKVIATVARALLKKGLVSEWHFGNHGVRGEEYAGEADRYGDEGWKVAQGYFNGGAEAALRLLSLKRGQRLENPARGKGTGNPWEGSDENPWKEREEDPLLYHWSRYVHLFTNQLGFGVDAEARLFGKQSERYARLSRDLGVKW